MMALSATERFVMRVNSIKDSVFAQFSLFSYSNLLTFTLLIFLVFELCVTFYTSTVISIFG